LRLDRRSARGFEARGWDRLLEALPPALAGRSVSRVYLGSEFCPFLAPTQRELDRALDAAAAHGLRVTVVLAPVRQTAARDAAARLRRLARRRPGLEVAANDWGTLAGLHGLGLVPVLGRLLFRMKRLPRFSVQTRPQPATPRWRAVLAAQMRELSLCPAGIPWFARLLRRTRVGRLEAEMVPQGIRLPGRAAVKLSLHLPWTYVTGGGACPAACRGGWIEPRFPYPTWPLVQVGNTVFASMSELLEGYLRRRLFDRYVLEPRLPL
jgi:hypothetical protein